MIERIQHILKKKNISASRFADVIGVQRSNVSHVLSGRNKPSLDFVVKILENFPEINADWLLFGKGSIQANEQSLFSEYNKSDRREEAAATDKKIKNDKPVNQGETDIIERSTPDNEKKIKNNDQKAKIRKIVLFYEDGSFEAYDANN